MASASTLTKELLAKISRGISRTRILDVPANGQVTLSTINFSTGGLLYSIEGSLNVDWAEPNITDIRVDQGLQTIAMNVEKGEITFSANYPSIAQAAIAYFFKTTDSNATVTTVAAAGQGSSAYTYVGKEFFLEPKTTEVSVCIEDADEKFAITMARVSLTARLVYDTDTRVWYLGLNGRVLANLKEGEADVTIGEHASS